MTPQELMSRNLMKEFHEMGVEISQFQAWCLEESLRDDEVSVEDMNRVVACSPLGMLDACRRAFERTLKTLNRL